MKISWIPWGIDLGTTNSVISCFIDKSPEVLSNQFGRDTTPSVVAISPGASGNDVCVGDLAIQKGGAGRFQRQFKRAIGSSTEFHFTGVDKSYSAFELSTLVVNELAKLRRSKGDCANINASVVTVPAAFNATQEEATRQAAIEAGFSQVVLFQEPVAAALAFGADKETAHNPFWLVYDLGGGTFDAALLRCNDGLFDIEDHLGDSNLGGSNLNEAIVNELLLPQFEDHERKRLLGDPNAIRLMEMKAEEAKCAVSFDDKYSILWDYEGSTATLEVFDHQVQGLETRLFARTVDLCRELLAKNNYKNSDIEKIIMVGGQTRSPHIREMLRDGAHDPKSGRTVEGLGIELDTSVDPMTVVSRGAAIYAASIRLDIPDPDFEASDSTENAFAIELADSLPAQTAGAQQAVAGCCIDAPPDITLVVQRHDGGSVGWESQVEVNPDGRFYVKVPLEIGPNPITLLAWDADNHELSRREFSILRSSVDPGIQKLPYGCGVVTVDGGVSWYFDKNSPIDDLDKEIPFRTTEDVEANDSESAIVIPLVMGESNVGYLNQVLSKIKIVGSQLDQRIPKNTEVFVGIEIPEPGLWKCTVVNDELNVDISVDIKHGQVATDLFWKSYEQARSDVAKLREVADNNPEVAATLREIEERRMFEEIDEMVSGRGEQLEDFTITAASARVIEIRKLLHPHRSKANSMLLWDAHLKYCDTNMNKADDIVSSNGITDAAWLDSFAALKARYRAAVEARDHDRLEEIAYTELPELFEQHTVLKHAVGSGMSERGQASTLDAGANLGSTLKGA